MERVYLFIKTDQAYKDDIINRMGQLERATVYKINSLVKVGDEYKSRDSSCLCDILVDLKGAFALVKRDIERIKDMLGIETVDVRPYIDLNHWDEVNPKNMDDLICLSSKEVLKKLKEKIE